VERWRNSRGKGTSLGVGVVERSGARGQQQQARLCQVCTVLYMADILSVELEKNSPLKCLRPYFSSAGFSSNIIDVRIRLLNPAQTILGSEHSAPIYICTVSRVDSLPKIDFSVFD